MMKCKYFYWNIEVKKFWFYYLCRKESLYVYISNQIFFKFKHSKSI